MTIHFPDVYSGQAGISFAGAPVAMVKATQGTGYVNPDFAPAKARAAAAGAFFCGYHYLEAGDGAGQATHCHAVTGAVPLMLDVELNPSGARPSVTDMIAFTAAYRALGGIVHLLYLPKWYWQRLGSPSLAPLPSRGLLLVSSNYTAYSDTGPGWQPYGGMTPTVWQYTASATFNGRHPVDFNAFKGTVAEFRSLAMTGTKDPAPVPVPQPPTWQEAIMQQLPIVKQGATGQAVRTVQGLLKARGYSLGGTGTMHDGIDGSFGTITEDAVRHLQTAHSIASDGIVGPLTWPVLLGI